MKGSEAMARYAAPANNRELIERMDQRMAQNEQSQRDLEKRWIDDRRLMLDTMRDLKHDSHAREQRIEASFKVLESRVESLRWWVLGVGLTVIAAIAAIVIGG